MVMQLQLNNDDIMDTYFVKPTKLLPIFKQIGKKGAR
jgi:hypothetical protein